MMGQVIRLIAALLAVWMLVATVIMILGTSVWSAAAITAGLWLFHWALFPTDRN